MKYVIFLMLPLLLLSVMDPSIGSNNSYEVYDDVATMENITELRNSIGGSNGHTVFVKGYDTPNDGGGGHFIWVDSDNTPDNDGTVFANPNHLNTGRWHRIITDNRVNVKWFGAKADGNDVRRYNDALDIAGSVHTNNSEAFQKAINFCIEKGHELYIPAGELYTNSSGALLRKSYILESQITVNSTLNIIGQPNTKLVGGVNAPNSFTGSIIALTNNYRGKIQDIEIKGHNYTPKAGIEFLYLSNTGGSQQNQGMELNNVKISNCKYGVYAEKNAACDRLVINRCELVSNIKAGFWLNGTVDSIDNTSNTTPIHFINTILNGNGHACWMDAFNGIRPIDIPGPYYQLYTNYTNNISFIGGQISNHQESRTNALVYLKNGRGANFQGVDLEGGPNNHFKAAGIHLKNFKGFNLTQSHIYQINTRKTDIYDTCNNLHGTDNDFAAVILLDGDCEYTTIKNIDLDNDLYPTLGNFNHAINVIDSNFQVDKRVFLDYDGPTHKLSLEALNALNKSRLDVLSNINGPIRVTAKFNDLFNYQSTVTNNSIERYGISNQLNETTYMEKELIGASMLYVVLETTQNAFDPDGKFFIYQYDSNNTRIQDDLLSTKGIITINGKHYASMKILANPNTKKIKYGFILDLDDNSTYPNAYIPEHATVYGFTLYADYKHPLLKGSLGRGDY